MPKGSKKPYIQDDMERRQNRRKENRKKSNKSTVKALIYENPYLPVGATTPNWFSNWLPLRTVEALFDVIGAKAAAPPRERIAKRSFMTLDVDVG